MPESGGLVNAPDPDYKEPLYGVLVKFNVPTQKDAEFIRERIADYVDSDELQDQQEAAVYDVELWNLVFA
jgi:hypothetical protein